MTNHRLGGPATMTVFYCAGKGSTPGRMSERAREGGNTERWITSVSNNSMSISCQTHPRIEDGLLLYRGFIPNIID